MSAPAPDGRGRRLGCGCLLLGLGLLLGVGLVLAVFFGFTRMIVDRGVERVPTDSVSLIAVDQQGSGFYAQVEFADRSYLWLESSDGGATWVKVDRPSRYSAGSSSALVCAEDEVCYLRRSGSGSSGSRVDRIDADGTWRTETTLAGCAVPDIVIQPNDSAQALALCGDSTVAHRTADGKWVEQNLISLAKTLR